ncbi:hypothetical protein VINI7043_07165 [Vibrio nigripulchritudo ATCC 27043]|uniref:Lcl C-terminal domain-containing protein n=1 Tax=Vibrio nigripulchritudo TaxID=28173 RepID=UPI00021C1876|nr:DUF1566 domain-containing protein [Vibrio nigripulchritudo]EGU57575.1 hypothetical protein VINI7043_07165 [Vibrio nigripulchritudo ATCC 27043]
MKTRLFFTLLMVCVAGFYSYFAVNALPVQLDHPRYVKITKSGDALKPWQGPWACVADTEQDLLWEVKTDDESIHDADWTYSWYNGELGDANKGDCFYQNGRCDTDALITRTNKAGLCGIHHWRLPTGQELIALLEYNDRPHQAQIATDFFPRIKNSDYWTQNAQQSLERHFRHLKHGALAVNLFEGKAQPLPYRNAAFVVLVADWHREGHTSQMTLSSITSRNNE